MTATALDTCIKDWRKPVAGSRAIFTTNRNAAFTREGFSLLRPPGADGQGRRSGAHPASQVLLSGNTEERGDGAPE